MSDPLGRHFIGWLIDWQNGVDTEKNTVVGRYMMVWVTQACASLSIHHGPLSRQRRALRHQHRDTASHGW